MPPHTGPLEVPSSLSEALILRLLKHRLFIQGSAAWTEFHVMRTFVKQPVFLRYVVAFRFFFIDVSLDKISHNLYSSHMKDLCLSFSEMSEERHSVWEKEEQTLIFFLFRFNLSPCCLLNYMCM